ncbi:hypothetical protein AX17_007219, partial [Amanita inopinata Kibby_2008]
MEVVQVNSEVMSALRGKVAFGVDREVGVVSLVGKEGRDTSSGTRRIVVGKFHKREELGPVVLLVVAEDAEVLLQSLVDAFGLTIAFGMIARCEVELHVKSSTNRVEEAGDELGALIGGDMRGNPVLGEDMDDEELG